MYYLYIARCKDKTLYTGIARDVEKRIAEHNNGKLGAKYTRSRRPVKLVYSRAFRTRSTAQREESRIKALSRAEKLALIKKNT